MAFAIASGLDPARGLVTGVVAGLVVSLLGGSQVQIAGPTGAFVVVLLGIVQTHGVDGLLAATVMAGALLVVLGLARLGAVIRYIPHPVTMGFTAGIGVIIFTGQIPDFLGLHLEKNPREFVEKVGAIARALPTISWPTTAVSAGTLAVLLLFPRVTRRVPSPLVGMVLATGAVLVLGLAGVETIGSKFGGIPSSFPAPRLPVIDWEHLGVLVGPAFTIAMLGAIESLLSAVVADGMTGDRHDSNQELIGQGLANLATPFFGGFAATGAIARTATNVRNGCRSPVGGVVHSAVLVVTMLVFAPWAKHVPLASLAAILFVVARNMREVRPFAGLLRPGSRSDRAVLLTTFGLTVFVDLVVAVEVGVVLAALLFMKQVASQVEIRGVVGGEDRPDPHHGLATALPSEIAVYSIDGPLFFGVAHRFESTVAAVDDRVRVVIVRLWRVPYLDASGVHSLRRAVQALRRGGRRVLLSGVSPPVRESIERDGLLAEMGEESVWASLEEALAWARDLVAEERLAKTS